MPPPRERLRFREREAARLARAIRQAGGGKMTLDPRTGTYTVEISSNAKTDAATDLDNWIAKHDASQT
jgi:hypothetical protein